jgi:hypothetical protein
VISVEGWVRQENVAKFLGHLAAYLQTTWDYLDDTALIGASNERTTKPTHGSSTRSTDSHP